MLIFLTSASILAESKPMMPAEVARFVEKRDICDHFRGEEPYDEERRQFLEKNLIEYCSGTDKELAKLKHKYKNNEAVIRKLNTYEEKIEASSFEK